jgi:hypothetical protein
LLLSTKQQQQACCRRLFFFFFRLEAKMGNNKFASIAFFSFVGVVAKKAMACQTLNPSLFF